ncbi:unnamed protein product, partial [Mesorhabditis belari]|uniref:TBC1 domain family member 23 n=1 Tax=Mesorhabditis belari TaxID=2138241 RepID=A0AAF3FJJ0_9BILA
MDHDILSESSSTIGDDWVKDANGSGSQESSSVKDVVDVLREISTSSEGSPVQKESELKARKWIRLLGMANRPDPLNDWDQLYNLKSQSQLRNDCRLLAKQIGNTRSVPELESFFTLYCKKRNMDYDKDSGWTLLLEKLIKFDYPNELLFNIFFGITTKYTPRETKPGAQVFDLFRLLLQYHEPELSSHLESIKCSSQTYAREWFSTLYACAVDDKTCAALWDLYIERGDPFLVFFLALAMVINAKEQLLVFKKEQREEAGKLLSELPKSLTPGDINDFVEVALYYSLRTPQCLREDFHGALFGSNLLDDFSEKNIRQMICLSVTPNELLRKDLNTAIEALLPTSYFVIDCRNQEAFRSGQVYGSFNLDAQLFVDAPEQFAFAHKAQEEYKSAQHPEDHYCFLGYGDQEKDQYMHMVISKFLRDGKMHVSFLEGGYRGLHALLTETGRLRVISSHDQHRCPECATQSPSKTAWGLMGLMKNAVISKGAAVKGKVQELVQSPTEPHIKHADPKDRHGKKYKKEKSVFSLDDEGSDEDPFTADGNTQKHDTEKEKVSLDIYKSQADVLECFECQEVMKGGFLIPAHIALTRTHMHILHDVLGTSGIVTTESRHPLQTVIRVTSKKKIPELLTFKFGYEHSPGEHSIIASHRFLISKAGECAKAVKTAIFALRPLPDE